VDQQAQPPKDWAAGMKDGEYHLSADLVAHAIAMIADEAFTPVRTDGQKFSASII
jgi:hypothetical protein